MPEMSTTTLVAGDETSLPRVTRATYNRSLLRRAQPALLHQRFGQRKPLSKRQGQSMVFRRYEKRDQATTPLTEGVTPTGTYLEKTDYVATLKQYGNYMIITDWIDLTWFDDTINEASELMGENMGESMDSVHRNTLVTGSSVYCIETDDSGTFAAGTTRGNVAGTICKSVLDAVIRDLDGENAKHFEPMVPGSTRVNTYPIGKSYWCLIHTDQIHDLYNNSHSGLTVAQEFTPIERYSGHTGVMETEVGKYRNIRFVATTNLKKWTGTDGGADTSGVMKETSSQADVYGVLVFARDAYGIVPLSGGSSKVIIHRAGGPSDPLNQRNTVGWKAASCAVILQDAWMCRIECASLA